MRLLSLPLRLILSHVRWSARAAAFALAAFVYHALSGENGYELPWRDTPYISETLDPIVAAIGIYFIVTRVLIMALSRVLHAFKRHVTHLTKIR